MKLPRYKGERIPPYRLLSFPSPRWPFVPSFLNTLSTIRGETPYHPPKEKHKIEKKKTTERGFASLSVVIAFWILLDKEKRDCHGQ